MPFGTYKLQAVYLNIVFSQLHKSSILPRWNEAGVAARKWQSEFSKQIIFGLDLGAARFLVEGRGCCCVFTVSCLCEWQICAGAVHSAVASLSGAAAPKRFHRNEIKPQTSRAIRKQPLFSPPSQTNTKAWKNALAHWGGKKALVTTSCSSLGRRAPCYQGNVGVCLSICSGEMSSAPGKALLCHIWWHIWFLFYLLGQVTHP